MASNSCLAGLNHEAIASALVSHRSILHPSPIWLPTRVASPCCRIRHRHTPVQPTTLHPSDFAQTTTSSWTIFLEMPERKRSNSNHGSTIRTRTPLSSSKERTFASRMSVQNGQQQRKNEKKGVEVAWATGLVNMWSLVENFDRQRTGGDREEARRGLGLRQGATRRNVLGHLKHNTNGS